MLSWNVFYEDFNKKEIATYNIFKNGHFEQIAKELKQNASSKEEFAKNFRVKLQSRFWCRSEYEVIITSWPPYIEKKELTRLNVEQETCFRQNGTYNYRQNVDLTVAKKIDIFSQLELNWDQFIDYVWSNS